MLVLITHSQLLAAIHNNLGMIGLNRSFRYSTEGELRATKSYFQDALRYISGKAVVLRNLGRLYHYRDDPDRALSFLARAAELDSRDPLTQLLLGHAYLSTGKLPEALHTWRLAHIGPRCFWGVGEQYFRQGDVNQALTYYQLAQEIDPAYPEAYLGLDRCYQAVGALDDAVASFETAVGLESTNPDAHSVLADALRQRNRDGDWSEAVIHPQDAIRHGYQCILAHIRLASLLEGLGRDDEALAVLKEAGEWWPHRSLPLAAMGCIYREKRNLDLVKSFLQSAVDKEPGYAPAHFHLALMYSQLGALDHAIRHFEEAVRLWPTTPGYRLTLAGAYQSAGDIARAVAEYQQILVLDPQNVAAQRALESLEGADH